MKTKLQKSSFIALDKEERELSELIESGKLVPDEKSSENTARFQKLFNNYKKAQTKTPISIRSNTHSLSVIKKFAQEKGVPYQKLLNMQIDIFAENIEEGKVKI